ncbi:hypothetical protein FNW52_20160 [Flavobacterium sp. ZT3R18]|nr:hypothetical protein FNW52_20160 [Flavobacterium sp. ZT3R18]
MVLFSAGIKRMNDIKKPWFYLFIPFYSFVLLLKKGEDEKYIKSQTTYINRYAFFKLLFISITIGLMNLVLFISLCHTKSMQAGICSLVYSSFLIVLSLIIFTIQVYYFKKKATNDSIYAYSLRFTIFSLIITLLCVWQSWN